MISLEVDVPQSGVQEKRWLQQQLLMFLFSRWIQCTLLPFPRVQMLHEKHKWREDVLRPTARTEGKQNVYKNKCSRRTAGGQGVWGGRGPSKRSDPEKVRKRNQEVAGLLFSIPFLYSANLEKTYKRPWEPQLHIIDRWSWYLTLSLPITET